MKLKRSTPIGGFTLGEALVCVGISSILFAGIFAASVGLNRAYAASDDYFSTHMQQIRILDYLSRDVKRSFSVTTSSDLRTVTCIIPNYTVEPGDPEAVSDPGTIGTRRTPVIVGSPNKAVVDYGARGTRTKGDGVVTAGNLSTLTSASAVFTTQDVGKPITGTGIPAGTTIASRGSNTSITLSRAATAGTGKIFRIFGDGNRTVTDAATTANSPNLTSDTAYFTTADVGRPVVGTTILAGAKIVSVTSPTSAVMSANANATMASMALSIGGDVIVYAVSGSSITRTENGVLTTIASSTDNLLPQTTDWQLSNTEHTTTTVTFLPIFTMNGNAAQRSGTTVFASAYLRNKRRGN